jgi:hypothetical protein
VDKPRERVLFELAGSEAAQNPGSLVLFVLGFLMLDIAQPIAGALFAVVGVVLAPRLPNHATPARRGDRLDGQGVPCQSRSVKSCGPSGSQDLAFVRPAHTAADDAGADTPVLFLFELAAAEAS